MTEEHEEKIWLKDVEKRLRKQESIFTPIIVLVVVVSTYLILFWDVYENLLSK